jgi:hypothetical protein
MSRSQIVVEKVMAAVTIAASGTAYSSAMDFRLCTGDAACVIASTAGSITVTQQCSADGLMWYDPETASGAAGAVEDGVTVHVGRYLSFTPVVCLWARFKVVATSAAETVVTLIGVYRVEV